MLDGSCTASGTAAALAIIGYVKTHHRRMLAREHWVRVPELTAGERSGLFAMEGALYGCYLRVGDPGPWAGPWAGLARLKMPSGIGRDAAVDAADHAAGWLPGFASAAAPGRAGPGEPDAGSRVSNGTCIAAWRCVRFARRCSNATAAADRRADRETGQLHFPPPPIEHRTAAAPAGTGTRVSFCRGYDWRGKTVVE